MKRFLSVVLFTFLILLITPTTVYAETASQQDYADYLSSYDLSFFEDTIGKDAYALLEELGISDFSYESISGLSLDDIKKVMLKMLDGKLKTPLEGVLSVIIYIILSAFFQSFKNDENSMSDVYATASALIISVVLLVKISPAVSLAASCIGVAADFIYAFVPVFGAIVMASGGITTAFSTNAMLLMLSQGLSVVASNIFMPVINCFLGIGICSSLRAELHLERLISSMRKIITTAISVTAGIFVSVLSIKTSVSARADILGIRSVRFVINSVVPVIGATISEGLLSIQSYSSLIKSSVGIVGIIAVSLVFLPALIEVVIWRVVLSLCRIISDVFEDRSVNLVLKAFSDTLLLINVVLIVSAMATVISIGVLIAAKTV